MIEGVQWAAVNGVVGRVVVAFEGDVEVTDLIAAVEEVEASHGLDGERFSHDRAEHPGDGDLTRRTLWALGADVAGFGVSLLGTVLRASPLPIELGALAGLVDSQPRLRHEVENLVGPVVADAGLALTNAVGQALSQGPLGLAVDATHRVNLLVSAKAREALWHRRHVELTEAAEHAAAAAHARQDRPSPLPRGPIETYADRAAIASLGGGAAILATTRSPRRAGAMVLAGMSRPGRLGRETFTAQLERAMAARGVIVLDQRATLRLDRVDCVVITAEIALTGRFQLDQVVTDPAEDRAELHRHLRRLFDVARPDRVRRSRGWVIGPTDRLVTAATPQRERLLSEIAHASQIGLSRDGQLVAVFDAAPEISPGVRQIIAAARESGHVVVVAGEDERLRRRIRADLQVDGGDALAGSIRSLQRSGNVVALIAADGPAALQAADVGIGVMAAATIPWGADIVCDSLEQARFVVEASGVADEVSRQSNAINLTGSSVAALSALNAPVRSAGSRATTTINLTSLASMANGARAAVSLDHRLEPPVLERRRWHEMSRSGVLRALGTSLGGLTGEEAVGRSIPVVEPAPAPVALARAVVAEMANPLTPVLAGGALLSATVGSVADAGMVASVMALNGVIAGAQRFTADRAVRNLVTHGEVHAHVRRDGEMLRVQADRLVAGDVVVLEAGDTVPADCRILQANALEVDESSLTGESQPVPKHAAASFGALITDRSCMAYSGTTVVAGSAVAVVVEIGENTEAAAREALGGDRSSTAGVEARLSQLSSVSLPVAGAAGLVLATGQLLRGGSIRDSMATGVSLAVAAVPEGLPMLATIGQLASARRLSSRDVLVRNPRAIEALGRIEVLCIDKTGTLTRGRIELELVSDGVAAVRSTDWAARHRSVLAAALRASPDPNGERSLPHFTDRAVVGAAIDAGIDTSVARRVWERSEELAFGPTRPFHAVLGRSGDSQLLSVKGAPEVLLDRCRTWRRPADTNGRTSRVKLDTAAREALERHVDGLARRGLRVLAVAERRYNRGAAAPETLDDDDVDGLTLIGFVALADPVRSTAAAAVRGLQQAGVEVVMVTGDHPSTAAGVAAELGILNGRRVLTGNELERMSDDELAADIEHVSVFARVTPGQKVRIVRAFQSGGRAVGMTGDGANDARAIRLADAGIAMGRHCAPAARSAADVIIADDRIETIVEAIIEGRALWASVRDALSILLGGNLGEIGFMLTVGGLVGRPPLNPRQILLVNLLTDVAPSLAIVARPPAAKSPAELALEGPDRSLGWQLNRAIAQRATVTTLGATSAWAVARVTGRARRASTVGLVSLVGTQLGQTLAIGRADPVVAAAALGSAGLLAGIVQTPGVSQFFGCTPLGPVAWCTAIGASVGATLSARFVPGAIDLVIDRIPALAGELGPSST